MKKNLKVESTLKSGISVAFIKTTELSRHPQKPVFNVDESMSVEDAKCLDRGYLLLRLCKSVEDPRSLVLVPSNEKVPR